MSADEWVSVIESVLAEWSQKSELDKKKSSEYIEAVASKLSAKDVALIVELLQGAYEEMSSEEDDFNPFSHEQSLLSANKNDLVKHFIAFFSLPSPGDKPANLGNLDWIPDSLLNALDLCKLRDEIRQSNVKALRQDQLQKLLEKVGPLSYGRVQFEYLCEVIASDIPRRRKVLDQIEALIDSWK